MKKNLKTMLYVALLVAVEVVLSRFCSISTEIVKIGFSFAPLAVCGMLFGPWWACLAGGMADLVGALLFPIGPYFPGFTLSNALVGLVFGFCLYKRFRGWKQILLAVAVNNFIISLFLSSFWLHLLYGHPYWSLMPWRLVQNAIVAVIEFVVIRALQKPMGIYAAHTRLHN